MTSSIQQRFNRFYTIFLLLLLLLTLSCTAPGDEPLPDLNWTDQFDTVHSELSRQYAFTDWKGIDWEEKYRRTAEAVLAAQTNRDENAFYLALRHYVISIPDTHVNFSYETRFARQLRESEIGGSFGMSGPSIQTRYGRINYPDGQSRDEFHQIQLDGDWSGNGGVLPDIRIPLTIETLRQWIEDGIDIELAFVRDYLNQ